MKKNTPMFQVMVTDAAKQMEIPVGPMMDHQEPLHNLAALINTRVVKGTLTGWRDAHVVQVAHA